MIFKYSSPVLPEQRWFIIHALSRMIEARPGFEPYKPMEYDDTFWTLDSANDWRLKFLDDGTFRVTYRYEDGTPREAALAGWLTVRMAVEIVDDATDTEILDYLADRCYLPDDHPDNEILTVVPQQFAAIGMFTGNEKHDRIVLRRVIVKELKK